VLQWVLLIAVIIFDLNFPIIVTGASVQGAFKVIMLFHVLVPIFSVILLIVFYRSRNEGIVAKCALVLSGLTFFFSSVSIFLHLVNDFVLFVMIGEIVSWSLFNTTFSVSVYQITVDGLTLLRRRFVTARGRRFLSSEKPQALG